MSRYKFTQHEDEAKRRLWEFLCELAAKQRRGERLDHPTEFNYADGSKVWLEDGEWHYRNPKDN